MAKLLLEVNNTETVQILLKVSKTKVPPRRFQRPRLVKIFLPMIEMHHWEVTPQAFHVRRLLLADGASRMGEAEATSNLPDGAKNHVVFARPLQ